jgi:hypothetical protein
MLILFLIKKAIEIKKRLNSWQTINKSNIVTNKLLLKTMNHKRHFKRACQIWEKKPSIKAP